MVWRIIWCVTKLIIIRNVPYSQLIAFFCIMYSIVYAIKNNLYIMWITGINL